MNSLYLQQTRSLFSSLITILTLVMTLFLIARSAAFLSLALESGLSALTFLKYIVLQIPVQITTLLPLCFFAACITTFNGISSAGEHIILRAAGVSQISFFSPAQTVGAFLCLLYVPFLFEVSPWANRNILEIKRQSKEQLAQNTLINAGEPTYIGAAEVYVQSTQDANLKDISLFGEHANGQKIFIHGSTANFIMGVNGISLMMSDGQVLQSRDQQPSTIQHFKTVLIDLVPLIETEDALVESTSTQGKGLFDLFRRKDLSAMDIRENQKEGGRRLAYLCLIFSMPSWILFWQLLDKGNRSGRSRIANLGPIFLVPVLILLEAPDSYAGNSYAMLGATLGFILALGFVGPFYFFALDWRLQRKIHLA